MTSWARAALGLAFVAVTGGLALASLVAPAIDAGPVLSTALLVVDTRVLLGLAVAIFASSFVLYLHALDGEDPHSLVFEGPSVEAIVPVYRDADVMHRSVEALAASEYRNLSVTIVPEPDDDASRERATRLAEAHDRVSVLVNEARQGTKAGALNAAIERSDADVIAMFDADTEPHAKLIPHAVAALESGNDPAEIARVRSLPDPAGGLVDAVAYYEYLLLYFLPQKLARAVLGMRVAGTRSVLVERGVFDEVGLFEEGHLAEDLDFTHRCHQADVAIRELLYYPTFEEPAHTLRDWWGQRVRWMTGQVQVSGSQLGGWRRLTDLDYLGSMVTLVGTLVAGVLLATTVPKVLMGLVTTPVLVGGLLAGLYGMCLATRFVDNRTAGTEGFGVAWLLIPVALTGFGLVIVQVILESALGRETGWYSVEKQAD